MIAIARLKGFALRQNKRAHRKPSRIAVLACATAAVALAAAGTSILLDHPGAQAMVVAMSPDHAAPGPVAAEALIDPTQYRKPAPAPDGRPRIAIIVRGLGVSAGQTARAIKDLPPDITLGLSPYAHDLQKTADAARAIGHEVFLDVPVEPMGFPANDAGPQALLSSIPGNENADRLTWSMARFNGYAGIVFPASSPALESAATMSPVLTAPAAKGLVWVHPPAKGFDGKSVEGVAIALAIDDTPKAESIDAALTRLEAKARADGFALAVAQPYPVTLQVLARWAETLEQRGIVLVPASALAVKPTS